MKNIYAIKDDDLGFTDIFTMDNDAIAIRGFAEMVNNEKSPFYRYPEKFGLYSLGACDTWSGVIQPGEVKKLIGAEQCKRSKNV